jgi:hypothetical protein
LIDKRIFLLLLYYPYPIEDERKCWEVMVDCWFCCVLLLGEYMREYMEERIHRIAERMSWKEFPIATKTGRNWGPLGGHTLSALVPSLGVIFSHLPTFFGLITQV